MLWLRRSKIWLTVPVIAIALSAVLLVSAATADEAPGLKVGATAPDFELTDQAGKQRQLSELLKQGTVALVFYRSAEW